MDLRRRAGALAATFGIEAVSSALDLAPSVLDRWRGPDAGGAQAGRTDSTAAFVELRTSALPVASCPELVLEVSGPRGRTVRIRGAMDLADWTRLVRDALSDEGR